MHLTLRMSTMAPVHPLGGESGSFSLNDRLHFESPNFV